jgi:hypothetical protein
MAEEYKLPILSHKQGLLAATISISITTTKKAYTSIQSSHHGEYTKPAFVQMDHLKNIYIQKTNKQI